MKKCTVCKKILPFSSFYKCKKSFDGMRFECKICKSIRNHIYNTSEIGRKKEKEYRKKYLQTEKGKIVRRISDSKRDKIKVYARWRIHELTRSGRLKRMPCKKCGYTKSQAHHPDYSKPEEIEWLCNTCHRNIHNSTSFEEQLERDSVGGRLR